MRFAVGYQLPSEGEEPLADTLADFGDEVAEVYFAWPGMPSGRSPMGQEHGAVDWEAQERLEADLRRFTAAGLKLDLLLNASCFGKYSNSRYLANRVGSVVDHLLETTGLDIVTTMSPMVARLLKEHFPTVEVRASINMRLGTVKTFGYVADRFDSYYVQREYNRDLERLGELKAWCDANGKGLHLLANSGCLNWCSVQTFHDNQVAHEAEAAELVNVTDRAPALCWEHYANQEHWVSFLQNSWVRPEDVHHYEPYVSVMKLATRMHQRPRTVIAAYCAGRYDGNLPNLFEPGHGPCFGGHVIDNTRFPADWFARTTACDKRCHACGYCAEVLEQVLVWVGE
jgi:collagenase-like PrtC family protease